MAYTTYHRWYTVYFMTIIIIHNIKSIYCYSSGASTASCSLVSSPGDIANGIQVVTDEACSLNENGCIDEICRFCKENETPLSSKFLTCQEINSRRAEVMQSVTASTQVSEPRNKYESAIRDTGNPSQLESQPEPLPVCNVSVDMLLMGISALRDSSCVLGSLHCYSEFCRYCKLWNTDRSIHFTHCFKQGSKSKLDCKLTDEDYTAGLDVINDDTCAHGGLGCNNEHCRYCMLFPTELSRHLYNCFDLISGNYESSIVNDSQFTALDNIKEDYHPTNDYNETMSLHCSKFLSDEHTKSGIAIVSDITCNGRSVGCANNSCRYCKLHDTPHSSNLLPCAYISTSSSDIDESHQYNTTNENICRNLVSSSEIEKGIFVRLDETCQNSEQSECVSPKCRYCSIRNTEESKHLQKCYNVHSMLANIYSVAKTETKVVTQAVDSLTKQVWTTPAIYVFPIIACIGILIIVIRLKRNTHKRHTTKAIISSDLKYAGPRDGDTNDNNEWPMPVTETPTSSNETHSKLREDTKFFHKDSSILMEI